MSFNPSILATDPVLSYNGYQFSPTLTRTEVEGLLEYSQDGRTIIGKRYRLRASSRILASSPAAADSAALTVRQQLEKPRGSLTFMNPGFGPLSVNSPGSANNYDDMEFGPKPRTLNWKRIGANLALDFEWVCEVVISECDPSSLGDVREYTTRYSYETDDLGLVTRNVRGRLRLALNTTQAGSTRLPVFADDTAHKYLELWFLPTPTGFRRTRQVVSPTEDKATVEFEYVDKEMGSRPWPKGAVRCRGRQSTRNQSPTALQGMFATTISASYVMDRTYDKPQDRAVDHFFGKLLPSRTPEAGVLITSFNIEEDLFDTGEVSMSATVAFPSKLSNLIADAKHFRPIPIETAGQGGVEGFGGFSEWKQSTPQLHTDIFGQISGLGTGEQVARRRLNYREKPTDPGAGISDLCNPPAGFASGSNGDPNGTPREQSGGDAEIADQTQDDMYLRYDTDLQTYTDFGVAVRRLIPPAGLSPITDQSAADNEGFVPVDVSQEMAAGEQTFNDAPGGNAVEQPINGVTPQNVSIQKRSGGVTYVVMSVAAVRIGKPVPVPRLTGSGGQQYIPIKSNISTKVIAYPFGLKAHVMVGEKLYVIKGDPGDLKVVPAPVNQRSL